MKKAFTMIELIFVIVVLGVLAAVALPKFTATRDDAIASKTSAVIATIVGEIAASYVAKPPYDVDNETNLSKMSKNLEMLEEKQLAEIDTSSTATKKAHLKIGDEKKCLTIQVESGNNEENLSVLINPTTLKLCQNIQQIIKKQDYKILLRGAHVNY